MEENHDDDDDSDDSGINLSLITYRRTVVVESQESFLAILGQEKRDAFSAQRIEFPHTPPPSPSFTDSVHLVALLSSSLFDDNKKNVRDKAIL